MGTSPIDDVPVGSPLRSVCKPCGLHLTCPLMSNLNRDPRTVHQAMSAGFRREQTLYPAGYGFPLPFGRWPSLFGLRFPLRDSALLASGLPAMPGLVGVSTFRS